MIQGRHVRNGHFVITIRGLSFDARAHILALGDGVGNVTLDMLRRARQGSRFDA